MELSSSWDPPDIRGNVIHAFGCAWRRRVERLLAKPGGSVVAVAMRPLRPGLVRPTCDDLMPKARPVCGGAERLAVGFVCLAAEIVGDVSRLECRALRSRR